jgi:hypothetical protein
MQELFADHIVLEFECEECHNRERDELDNIICNGAPLCTNAACLSRNEEMTFDKVFLQD